jgi:poly(3-hydroxybutyrate) depolymerase
VLTELLGWQRASLRSWLMLGRAAWQMLGADPRVAGPLAALADLALLNLEVGEATEHDLRSALARDAGRPVALTSLLQHPFATVRALRLEGVSPRRRVLLATPYSGYATTVLSGLIAALLEDSEILVTDWRDARLVPTAAGSFDLADQIRLLAGLMRDHGPGLHVVALSQATVPALLATAALAPSGAGPARRADRRSRGLAPGRPPATLSLLGGPIDPRRNPTAANHLLLSTPPAALESTWFRTVDSGHPGAGRRVLPSLHHLLLFALAHPEPYLRAQVGAFFELAGLELAEGGGFGFLRSLEDLHALIDVPAELVVQMLRQVFQAPVLFDRGLRIGHRRLHPRVITETALLTVEASADALVGPGQTHAAHALTPALGAGRRGRLTLEGAAHYDLFTGPLMTKEVAPALRNFMAASSGPEGLAVAASAAGRGCRGPRSGSLDRSRYERAEHRRQPKKLAPTASERGPSQVPQPAAGRDRVQDNRIGLRDGPLRTRGRA